MKALLNTLATLLVLTLLTIAWAVLGRGGWQWPLYIALMALGAIGTSLMLRNVINNWIDEVNAE